MVTNKSQSDSSFCVIINIFENKGLFMMHKKIRNKDYYIFILTEICGADCPKTKLGSHPQT